MNLNVTYGAGPVPYGPKAGTRTLDQAGSAAVRSATRRERGLRAECCRGLGEVTPQQCAALYRLGDEPCVSRRVGRCSLGMIEAARQPEENDMSEKNKWLQHQKDYMKAGKSPEDTDHPFILAGIEFAPLHKRRPTGRNALTVRHTSLGISMRACEELHLQQYTHARYTVSTDGTAIAIKLLSEARPDAVKIQHKRSCMYISAVPLVRRNPKLIGKRARLESTDLEGWFVARFDREAA